MLNGARPLGVPNHRMPDKWKSTVELVCCGFAEETSEPSQGQSVCIPQKYHSDVLHFHRDGRVAQ